MIGGTFSKKKRVFLSGFHSGLFAKIICPYYAAKCFIVMVPIRILLMTFTGVRAVPGILSVDSKMLSPVAFTILVPC